MSWLTVYTKVDARCFSVEEWHFTQIQIQNFHGSVFKTGFIIYIYPVAVNPFHDLPKFCEIYLPDNYLHNYYHVPIMYIEW